MLKSGDAVVYKCRGVYKVADIGTLNFSFCRQKEKVLYLTVYRKCAGQGVYTYGR